MHVFYPDLNYLSIMKSIKILFVSMLWLLCAGCTKETHSRYKAEGFVYEKGTTKKLSNVPIILSECHFTGTRCVYSTISIAYTDANGYYKISGNPQKGALYIEAGTSEKTFGTPKVNGFRGGEVFHHDFYVEIASYITTRFIVQTQNRNFALVSTEWGVYAATRALFRNPPAFIDTTFRSKIFPGSEVRLAVTLRNENMGNPSFSDSLLYSKIIGVLNRDTTVVWIVP